MNVYYRDEDLVNLENKEKVDKLIQNTQATDLVLDGESPVLQLIEDLTEMGETKIIKRINI